MAQNIARFLLLFVLALLVGTMFGIWVGFDPSALSAAAYVEQQQNAIRSLNALLPAMGAACIVLAAILALLSKPNPRARVMLAAVVVLLVIAALVTRFGNQPINAIVMTWSAQSPPAQWVQLRDQWWHWHVVRSLAAMGALALAILSVLALPPQRQENAP
jgi:uncharacterized membrane protein